MIAFSSLKMVYSLFALIFCLVVCDSKVCEINADLQTNNRPIVGVLTQRYWGHYKHYANGYSYIAASYVKYLESAGARVVPIQISRDYGYYKQLFKQINGILLPGGNQYIGNSEYSDTAVILWNLTIEANQNNDYFPLWGTCLGFEALFFLQANQTNFLTECDSQDVALQLNFSFSDPKRTKLFQSISPYLFNVLKHDKVTVNYHSKCMTLKNFTFSGLNDFFAVLSTNKDVNGLEFISSVEAKKYPIYGVQFHPEKNAFEYILNKDHKHTPHSADAISVTQYFANFFVNETRKNFHCFATDLAENKALIYNYKPEFTGYSGKGSYDQTYFFKISNSSSMESSHLLTYLLCVLSCGLLFILYL